MNCSNKWERTPWYPNNMTQNFNNQWLKPNASHSRRLSLTWWITKPICILSKNLVQWQPLSKSLGALPTKNSWTLTFNSHEIRTAIVLSILRPPIKLTIQSRIWSEPTPSRKQSLPLPLPSTWLPQPASNSKLPRPKLKKLSVWVRSAIQYSSHCTNLAHQIPSTKCQLSCRRHLASQVKVFLSTNSNRRHPSLRRPNPLNRLLGQLQLSEKLLLGKSKTWALI